ncbi:MAG: hypothetical protein QM495_03655 [Lutibacter sp.]|uniref:hypothetical protein n=1 Tax=Lutibacter sp. TaxID=1925666 RepID=UPI00385C20F4
MQSCIKDIDFNQIDDASIHTTYLATLIHLNLTVSNFLNEFNEEIIFTKDLIQAPISDDSRASLEKIEFTVVTENTFDRNFILSVIFYDESSQAIYELTPEVNIPKNTSELTTIIEIPEEDIHVIYNTKYFGFTMILLPSEDDSVLTINETSTLEIQSFVKLFFNYKNI